MNFFREPVAARAARQLGAALITETMDRRPDIGFVSYNRLLPSQDTMPLGGFGNLIMLPLQRAAREVGNSVFVDADMWHHDDQWAFLLPLPRLSAQAVSKSVEDAERSGRRLRNSKRSTKAGALTPATQKHAGFHLAGVIGRSTKAGALTPATLAGPSSRCSLPFSAQQRPGR